MTEINLSDYVLESKAELTSLADAIREKSKVTGELSVADMKAEVEGISGVSEKFVKGVIERNITEIEIPQSVTSVGRYGFAYCGALKTVVMHENVQKFSQGAFQNCGELEGLDIPYGTKTIPQAFAMSCGNLGKVTLPNTITSIARQAFLNCSRLKEIYLPNSITTMGDTKYKDVFGDGTSISALETIYCDWAEGEKPTVEANAPWGAINADTIYIGSTKGVTFKFGGNGYTVTGFDMEQYSGEPIDLVIGPQYNGLPVTAIADEAFGLSKLGNRPAIKSVSLPDTLKKIGVNAFGDQSLGGELVIPDSVTNIGNGAFAFNSSMSEAVLGAGCKNMPADVFFGCTALTSITAHRDEQAFVNAPWGAMNAEIVYDGTYSTYGLQYEYDATLSGYKVIGFEYDEDLSSSAVVIPVFYKGQPVLSISSNAFYNMDFISSIDIPHTVISIDQSAFNGCTGLTSITVDENNDVYKSINGVLYTFDITTLIKYPCKRGDTRFVVPQTIQNISNRAFEGCGSGFTISLAYVSGEVSGAPWGADGATITHEHGGGGVVPAPDDWT